MTDYESKSWGCEVADDLLSAYIDGELDETEAQFVRKHVETCEICPVVLDDMEATINALAALPREAIPEHDLWDDIVAEYEATSGIVDIRDARQQKSGWFTKGQLLAAAIAAVMLPGVFYGGMMLGMRNDDGERGNGVVRVVDRFDPAEPDAVPAPEPVVVPALPEPPSGLPRRAPRAQRDRNAELAAVIQGLITALDDSDPDVRRSAAQALGDMDDVDEAVPALIQSLLRDNNGEVRRWSAYALGEIDDERAVPALVQALLNDNHDETRRWSAWALSEIQDESAVPALASALSDDNNAEVRRWSAYALGEIGDPSAAPALTAALNDSSAEVRRWATWALAEIADGF